MQGVGADNPIVLARGRHTRLAAELAMLVHFAFGKVAVMLVICPPGKTLQREGTTLSCDGIVIYYQPAANNR